VSSPYSKHADCRQQGHAGSKTLHQQNPPVLNWRCQLTQVDLYDGRKMVVVVVVAIYLFNQLPTHQLADTNCKLADIDGQITQRIRQTEFGDITSSLVSWPSLSAT